MMTFQIEKNGTVKGLQKYLVKDAAGELLATVSPQFTGFGYSERFLNVCHNDGKIDLADGIDAVPDIIEAKYFSRKPENTDA